MPMAFNDLSVKYEEGYVQHGTDGCKMADGQSDTTCLLLLLGFQHLLPENV